MPTIIEAAVQLRADDLPVLFIDTCILLDILRTPLRPIPKCVENAIRLAEMQSQSACRVVASSMIQTEWNANEPNVSDELDRHLSRLELDAERFHEICGNLNIQLTFTQSGYRAVHLGMQLKNVALLLLADALHLTPSDDIKARASDRTLARKRPAQKGGGLQDCVIIEEYLELSRQLSASGFAKRIVFCSSNSSDYQDGSRLHKSLESEFANAGLIFTNSLRWAVSELQRP